MYMYHSMCALCCVCVDAFMEGQYTHFAGPVIWLGQRSLVKTACSASHSWKPRLCVFTIPSGHGHRKISDQGLSGEDCPHHAGSERQRPACSAESQDRSYTDLLSSQE